MFYPGDPIEERKRQLISRLAGRGRGGSAGGFKIGRAPGFFGRGIIQGIGGDKGAFGHAIASGLLGGFLGGGGFEGGGGPVGPSFATPGGPRQYSNPSSYFNSGPSQYIAPQQFASGPTQTQLPNFSQLIAQLQQYGAPRGPFGVS